MLISLVINCDTRGEKNQQTGLFGGVVNPDFLEDGIRNKQLFFAGFDIETIVFIDEHLPVPETTLSYLKTIADTIVIRKHTSESHFNDYNYLAALSLARGKYVCHFDQDVSAFTNSSEPINKLIALLDEHKFISYPSQWSPKAVNDLSFGKRTWASTRFFLCKKETLKFDILRHCIEEPEWAYETFGDSPRRCNWLEHFLSLSNNDSVYYPPHELNEYVIFTWENYEAWTLRRLNEFTYDEIKSFIHSKGGIFYPNQIKL